MLIVCDTNVLISGLVLLSGNPDKIIRAIFSGRVSHATSPDLLTEFGRVAEKKFGFSGEDRATLLELISRHSAMVYPITRLSIIRDDPTDNRVLECAVMARANYIVTGDQKHLLPLQHIEDTEIISPRQFVQRVVLL